MPALTDLLHLAFQYFRRRFRFAGLVSHQELVRDGVACRVEESGAAANMAPALEMQPARIGTDEEELLEILSAERSDVGRPHDMGLAGIGEFDLRPVFLAI